ncbi:isoprenoid synthase domain-containing protein [Pelagophyceae sp. CCMP2097]|nr:isoprenoid synthase domain-containing protein [Pelagophyceae sp. CCMP2097]
MRCLRRLPLGLRPARARAYSSQASEIVVNEIRRQISSVADDAPACLSTAAWSPTAEELRKELRMSRMAVSPFEGFGHVDPFILVGSEIENLDVGVRGLVQSDNALLTAAAKYFFEGDSGKKFRATMVLLTAKACSGEILPSQTRLAEIVEMIHTASLFHDDVIDMASTRRGRASANAAFGDKVAILAGDFLLSRACVGLARLRNLDVIELISTVIEHLVRGEIMQMRPAVEQPISADVGDPVLEAYLAKNFYKTGSLMANSCRAAAMLAEHNTDTCDAAFRFGRHVGLAFQLVDDVLDFEGSEASLGKPALADLRQGIVTAPTLLAAHEVPELRPLIARKFCQPGDVDAALDMVKNSNGVERARELAYLQAELAAEAVLRGLPPSDARSALVTLASKVVTRRH